MATKAYRLENSRGEEVRSADFIERFNFLAGNYGKYDYENAPDKSKPFYLNKLWLSWDEAMAAVEFPHNLTSTSPRLPQCAINLPTFLPFNFGGCIYDPNNFAGGLCPNRNYPEVIVLRCAESNGVKFSAGQFAFSNLRGLKEIRGKIDLSNWTYSANFIYYCMALEEIDINRLKADMMLWNNNKLSCNSFRLIVSQAINTAPITITVHADVYAALQGEAESYPFNGGTQEEWERLLADALDRQINFATA